jgi:pSer/pThr/pTyr-binding forkhead associated (FHA) protein
VLRDLGSTNGTRINGQQINPEEEHRLQDGDTIRLGHIETIYVSENPDAARPMPAEQEPVAVAAQSSSKPSNFSNASPFQTKKKKKDPAGAAILALAGWRSWCSPGRGHGFHAAAAELEVSGAGRQGMIQTELPRLACVQRELGGLTADPGAEFWREIGAQELVETVTGGKPEQRTRFKAAWNASELRVLFEADDLEPLGHAHRARRAALHGGSRGAVPRSRR